MSREPVTPLTPEQQQHYNQQKQYQQQEGEKQTKPVVTSEQLPDEQDDSDFVLVVNRKKTHTNVVDTRKYHSNAHQRQSDSHYYDDDHHGGGAYGRRRKYRDRGGGSGGADTRGGSGNSNGGYTDQKNYGSVRKPRVSSRHDKENMNKTAPPSTPPPPSTQHQNQNQPPARLSSPQPQAPQPSQPVQPPPTINQSNALPAQRCYSLVVAGGSTTTPTRSQQQPQQQIIQQPHCLPQKWTQTERVSTPRPRSCIPPLPDDELPTALSIEAKRAPGTSTGGGPSTSSSIPDTSSLTSEETLDSLDRKASSEVGSSSSNGDNTLHVVEYVDAPAPRVNPWVANKNAAHVIVGTDRSSSSTSNNNAVALSGFPTVSETFANKTPVVAPITSSSSAPSLSGPTSRIQKSQKQERTGPAQQPQQQQLQQPPSEPITPEEQKHHHPAPKPVTITPGPVAQKISKPHPPRRDEELPKKPDPSPVSQKQQQSKSDPPMPPPLPPQEEQYHHLDHDQKQEQSVYVREMSNGFRPGRGRGSHSGSASSGRRIPSRSSVLMTKVVANEPDDWPTLGQTVIPNSAKKSTAEEPTEDKPDGSSPRRQSSCSPPLSLPTELSAPPSSVPAPPQAPQNQIETTSSSDNDEELNQRNQRRGSKPKWVPFDMTSSERGGYNGEGPFPHHHHHHPSHPHTQPPHDGYSKQKTNKTKRAFSAHYYGNTYQRPRGKENVAIGNDYSDYNNHQGYHGGGRYSSNPSQPRASSHPNHRSGGPPRGLSSNGGQNPQSNSARTRRHTHVPQQQTHHHNYHHQTHHHSGMHHQQQQQHHSHPPHHRSTSTLSLNNHPMLNGAHLQISPHHAYELLSASPTQPPSAADFQDYPGEYTTTLTPMYPAVSEFIMPYVANGYFPTPFTPPAGVIVDTTTATTDVVTATPIVLAPPPPPPATTTSQVVVTSSNHQASAAFTNGDVEMLTDLVRTQIEYYFSEQNLTKDFYLRRQMDAEGYLPIQLLATFPRVTHMTQEYSIVLTAIESSETLELKPDLSSVRTTITPMIWPLPADPGSSSSSTASSSSSDASQLEKKWLTNINNNNPPGLPVDRVETLNPNVPEFVPKSKVTLF